MKPPTFKYISMNFKSWLSLFSLVLLSATSTLYAQACLPQGVVFTTQNELNQFKTTYPDCKIIEGDLVVGSYSTLIIKNKDIVNLSPLGNIEEVKGNLIISSIENLIDLSALAKLKKVGKDIIIQGNSKMESLKGLEKITGVEGKLELFSNNVAKMSTKGLDNIKYIKGDLNIKSFATGSLEGLSNLDSIHGSLYVWGDGVNNFSKLTSLKFIGKNISIYDSEISSFQGLSAIKEIYGNLSVVDNPISFSGLNNVEVIHGNFEVRENGTTGSFAGLTKLREVKGNVYLYEIGKAEIKTLTALQRIGGTLSLIHSNLIGTPLAGMPALKYIGGDLYFYENDLLNDYGDWPKLDTIQGSLIFNYHYSLTTLNGFNQLKYIGKNLSIESNKDLISIGGFSSLTNVNGNIEIKSNAKLKTISRLFNTPNINGFYIYSNPLLTTLALNNTNANMAGSLVVNSNAGLKTMTGLPALQSMHAININLNNALTDISIAPELKLMNGQLLLSAYYVKEISAFTKLDTIKGGIDISGLKNAGKSLEQFLPGLRFFDGGFQITQMAVEHLNFVNGKKWINGPLKLQAITNLNDLNVLSELDSVSGDVNFAVNVANLKPLSKLKKINGIFSINSCDSITTLEGLENLRAIKSTIYISFNDKLNSIEALKNVDTSLFKVNSYQRMLSISNNPKLDDCEIKLVCQLMTLGPDRLVISNNGINCSSLARIDCLDSTMMSGRTFLDLNKNYVFDSLDVISPLFNLSVNNGASFVFSNGFGRYIVPAVPDSKYILKAVNNENIGILGDSIEKTFKPTDPNKHTVDIPLFFLKDTLSGTALIPGPKTNRCSEIVEFKPKITNTGTQKSSYRLRLYKSNYTLSNSYPTPKYTQTSYDWEFTDLTVLSSTTFSLNLKMPNFMSAGHDLLIPYVLYIRKNNDWVALDSNTYQSKIVCAYDPNDKNVEPSGKKEENFVLKDETLTYTIRFQNTGNAEARDVWIRDTLDPLLDMSTFQLLESSHKVYTEQRGPILEFYFRNIWLPDSLTNKEGSKGYLVYSIKANADIEECTVVKNKAGIYFDFNPPVITNSTLNTLVTEICEDTVISIDTTICNGASIFNFKTSGTYVIRLPKEKTCDTIIQLKLKVIPSVYKYNSGRICVGDTIKLLSQEPIVMPPYAISITDTLFKGDCIDTIYSSYFSPYFSQYSVLDTTICEGYTAYDQSQSGTYKIPIINAVTNCYDTLILNLTVLPITSTACISQTADSDLYTFNSIPNPSTGIFQIKGEKDLASIRIYNTLGQAIDFETLENKQFYIAVPGIYFIEVITQQGKRTIIRQLITR
ncbi:MAG: T9SS type A sorting domain-containing protein [Saprospiraceae bacterium]|nr:T9SS type A sorting domain-containing protein [Saprospiraceae bacterium]